MAGIAFVTGINLTAYATNWRQLCNTCIANNNIYYILNYKFNYN